MCENAVTQSLSHKGQYFLLLFVQRFHRKNLLKLQNDAFYVTSIAHMFDNVKHMFAFLQKKFMLVHIFLTENSLFLHRIDIFACYTVPVLKQGQDGAAPECPLKSEYILLKTPL